MFQWISARISMKIAIVLFLLLSLSLAAATWLLVRNRGDALREQLLVKARTMAILGAETIHLLLEQAYAGGTFTREEIFATDYRPIDSGPLAKSPVPKFNTVYDSYLDRHIRKTLDAMVEQDPAILFAAPVDRNGYLPSHNSKFSQPLSGDPARDRVVNQSKQMLDDEVGRTAARFTGSDGQQVLRQEYRLPDGTMVWDVAAPVFVNKQHWGVFRVGLSMAQLEQAETDLRNSLTALDGLGPARLFRRPVRHLACLCAAAQPADAGRRPHCRRATGRKDRDRHG